MTDEAMTLTPSLSDVERVIADTAEPKGEASRAVFRKWLAGQLETAPSGNSLGEILGDLAKAPSRKNEIAAVLLRALDEEGLVPEPNSTNNISRNVVAICEGALPDLCSYLSVKSSDQTFEKFARLKTAHYKILELLHPVREPYQSLEAIISAKKQILGSFNHKAVRLLLLPYRWSEAKGAVEVILSKLGKIHELDANLLGEVEDCRRAIQEGVLLSSESPSPFSRDVLLPFIKNAEKCLDVFLKSIHGRFSAQIALGGTGRTLQKRYPLHEAERDLKVLVALKNLGPGRATDVRVTVASTEEAVVFANSEIALGNIPPGDFSVTLECLVIEPCAGFEFCIQVEWGELGIAERKAEIFDTAVIAQKSDIDWNSLEYLHPYSTAVAKGQGFVGRDEQVKMLVSRVLRRPMEPTFITGQKRVGKTSLAIAAMVAAEANDIKSKFVHHYILWGEISHEDPRKCLEHLGKDIEDFILSQIDARSIARGEYDGSLSHLIKLARAAAQIDPDRRFAIIIDEFDEMPQELYLHGNLAETLFANLRAITTTDNLCIILVGGENMPFVMQRQGQKLNKYSSVNVTYFSRETEWETYKDMIKNPVSEYVAWHDDAISEVFNVTNGNPYFTKVICSEVFSRAVTERDADITSAEIFRALDSQIPALDANLFAHLWQDGIPRPEVEREPVVFQRSNVLVALARCFRKNVPATLASIAENKSFSMMQPAEIVATLNDFVRRGVLVEHEGCYDLALPIFRKWLVEAGVSRLISDALTEELVSEALRLEDEAHVDSREIVKLAETWPTYRGRPIGSDDIRTWLQQVESNQEQRLLFELLKNVRFLSEAEIRQKLKSAHSMVRSALPDYISRSLSDRRKDVVITYVDGQGKSGQNYSSAYAEENRLSINGIIPPDQFNDKFISYVRDNGAVNAVIIIDDIAATGKSLSGNVTAFIENNREILEVHKPVVLVVALLATKDADRRIRAALAKIDYQNIDFRAGEILDEESSAFSGTKGVFASEDQKDRAKALARDLGARIYKQSPLGFGEQALLVVLPTTVPNNSLPILHSHSKSGSKKWIPIFPRIVN